MIHAAKVQIYSWLDKLYQPGKSAEPILSNKKSLPDSNNSLEYERMALTQGKVVLAICTWEFLVCEIFLGNDLNGT